MATGVRKWSQTSASNNTADSNVDWAEGMAPSAINNSARAEMASVAMWRDDNGGTLVTTGSTTAYTVTSNQTFDAYANGDTISVKFHATNDSSASLNVDGIGARKLQLYDGQNLRGGEFIAGSIARFTYTSASTSWILNNFARPSGTVDQIVGVQASSTSTSVPAYSFFNDTDTGLYRVGADELGLMVGGIKVTDISTSGVSVAGNISATGNITGSGIVATNNASQAQQEATTATTVFVTPAVQQYHPSAAKVWVRGTYSGGTPQKTASYNVSSLTDTNTGQVAVNFTTAFSTASGYTLAGISQRSTDASGSTCTCMVDNTGGPLTASDADLLMSQSNSSVDPVLFGAIFFGDQ